MDRTGSEQFIPLNPTIMTFKQQIFTTINLSLKFWRPHEGTKSITSCTNHICSFHSVIVVLLQAILCC